MVAAAPRMVAVAPATAPATATPPATAIAPATATPPATAIASGTATTQAALAGRGPGSACDLDRAGAASARGADRPQALRSPAGARRASAAAGLTCDRNAE